MKRALVLFAHGARDPKWAAPFERLQQLVQTSLPDVAVSLAFLELMSPSLPDLAAQLVADGCSEMTVVPIFLGQGGHLQRDLPLIVERLRADHAGLKVKVVGAAGEDDGVLDAIAAYCVGSLQ
jgi:sirohydrochlorin cobaltochelatase